MAVETNDYKAVLKFLRRLDPDLFGFTEPMQTLATGRPPPRFQTFLTGWPEPEGAMLLQPAPAPPADLHTALIANSERALRDLLMAFPPRKLGLFHLNAPWMQPTLSEFFDGRLLPAPETDPGEPAAFLGIKRGTGDLEDDPSAGQRARTQPRTEGQISSSKDPLLARFRDLGHAAGRREHAQFIAEGLTLVHRAVEDGLPVEAILHTPALVRLPEGQPLLDEILRAGLRHYSLTEGLLAKVTTTRPVPEVVAAVHTRLRDAREMDPLRATTVLIAEQINNPDNLGMLLRTADAAGAGAVVVIGEGSDPLHKNCIRAARGAVGRLPLYTCREPLAYLDDLCRHGFRVVGATGHAEAVHTSSDLKPPIALIVGNEQAGISPELLDACTGRVRIPMAPGQDSLNVGVAAGVLLYEVLRQRTD